MYKRRRTLISSLDKLKTISVLNYNENYVCVKISPNRSVRFEPASYGEPTMVPLTLDEIKYANNSTAFKSGVLEFPENIEDEVYEELRIDKTKILKLNDIKEILLNPTKEGLIKILSITSLANFDRVRGQFQKLKFDGYTLTLDVADIIDRRTKELFNNQVKSNIRIGDSEPRFKNDKRVDELEKQLEEMKVLMAQMLKNAAATTTEAEINKEVVEDKPKTTTKKPGRPRKTT